MSAVTDLAGKIKRTVISTFPNATVILYGSHSRGDNNPESDWDILVLLNKDPVTANDEKLVKYPLYDLEFETGEIISPLVLSKNDWETRHRITPFYHNVLKDGKVL